MTVQRWLAALPGELVAARPRLLLAQARLALLDGRVEEAEGLLDAAERALTGTGGWGEEPYEPSIGRGASLLANIPATIAIDRAYLAELRGDADRAVGLASRALAEIGEDEWMLASNAGGYLALAEWLRGHLPEAERGLSATIARWLAVGERHLAARGYHHLGQVQRAQGRLDAALETYRQALDVAGAAQSGRPALPAVGIGHVGLAEVAYERGELETALRHVTEGIRLSRRLAYTQPLATGLATLGAIRQAKGDEAGAREVMEEAVRVAAGPGLTALLHPVPVRRARLLLAQGDVEGAARWVRERGLDPGDRPRYPKEPEQLVLARVLLATDRAGEALGLLERLEGSAAAQGRGGSLIEIGVLRARALVAGGDEAGALGALTRALTLACPQGYVRVFTDEGAVIGALLGRLIAARRTEAATADGVPLSCLARLLRGFGAEPASRGGTPALPGLAGALTARELEVLGLLAAGRSNQRIAEELVVTLDTVKKHVSHVLEKLGATNRTEAVATARELGLLG